jgi:large subunit ribosomal protein L11
MSQEKKKSFTLKLKNLQLGNVLPSNSSHLASVLGSKGVGAKMFYDQFNTLTGPLKDPNNDPVYTEVICYSDKSLEIRYKKAPPVSFLVKKILGIVKEKKNKKEKTTEKVRLFITKAQIEEIAILKQQDLNVSSLEKAIKTIEGTVRSMSIGIKD